MQTQSRNEPASVNEVSEVHVYQSKKHTFSLTRHMVRQEGQTTENKVQKTKTIPSKEGEEDEEEGDDESEERQQHTTITYLLTALKASERSVTRFRSASNSILSVCSRVSCAMSSSWCASCTTCFFYRYKEYYKHRMKFFAATCSKGTAPSPHTSIRC